MLPGLFRHPRKFVYGTFRSNHVGIPRAKAGNNNWPEIFNHDATLTSAVLDRLLHHAETVTVEGNSFRMKDVIDN